MRSPLLAALALLLCALARADPVADLKHTLAQLDGQEPVKASVTYAFWSRTGEDKAPVIQEATINATAEEGQTGLKVGWSHELIQTIAAEKRAKSEDPEKRTPTQRAMDDLGAGTLHGYLNAAPGLALTLERAKLVDDQPAHWHDRPARLLTFKLNPPLSKKDREVIREADATAKIWVGADGFPLAEERRSRLKGRAMLVITFEFSSADTFEFARVGHRLVVVRHVQENSNAGAGEKGQQKTTTVLALEK
ncbi:MAG: hypothetical protein HY302_16525 [Opitutae bacterium]|nr:hypothetical protein [Opitutae bacterium]